MKIGIFIYNARDFIQSWCINSIMIKDDIEIMNRLNELMSNFEFCFMELVKIIFEENENISMMIRDNQTSL